MRGKNISRKAKAVDDKATLVVPGTAINQVPESSDEPSDQIIELVDEIVDVLDLSEEQAAKIGPIVRSHLQGMEMDNMASN